MARVMREELCTMIRVRGNIGVLVALAGLLVACAGGSSQWQRERLTALPKAGDVSTDSDHGAQFLSHNPCHRGTWLVCIERALGVGRLATSRFHGRRASPF